MALEPDATDGLRTVAVLHLAELSGPAKTMRLRLAGLARRGSLEVLSPGHGSLESAYAGVAPVRVLPYSALTVPRGAGEAIRALRGLARDVRLFRRELRRARPDLVVVVTSVLPAALLAARLERLPTIAYVGELFSRGYVEGRARALGGRLVAGLLETCADRLVCCSGAVADQFRRSGKAVAIYPGITADHAHGDGDALRARLGLERARPLIAVLGSITPTRGQDVAVRALAPLTERHPDAHLLLVGTPPGPADEAYRARLEALVRELGLEDRTVFAGFVERPADVYAAADVVVNPARVSEAFGRVAPEALVAGRPVVASAVGAIPEVLRDGRDALLVAPDDPRALADAVARIVEDESLAQTLVSEGGRRVRERFSEEEGIRAFERVVAEVLGGRRGEA